jgi:hypothetical protein
LSTDGMCSKSKTFEAIDQNLAPSVIMFYKVTNKNIHLGNSEDFYSTILIFWQKAKHSLHYNSGLLLITIEITFLLRFVLNASLCATLFYFTSREYSLKPFYNILQKARHFYENFIPIYTSICY